MSFNQSGQAGKTHEHIICHNCGRNRHYANQFLNPSDGESNGTGKQMLQKSGDMEETVQADSGNKSNKSSLAFLQQQLCMVQEQ